MTLQPYGPDQLDELAWRAFDLAALLRQIGQMARSGGLGSVPLHDKKPREWLSNLEVWAHDAQGRMQTELVRNRGAKRAKAGTRRGS
ncbi:MAG: hypothetical protein K8T25_01160 [Planctomycetia bacterium]|nr:hypothetical protein [Planctomycetia bacterium]